MRATLPRRALRCKVPLMRGYFAIGVEGVSKAFNVGNLVRSALAFGASFAFTIDARLDKRQLRVSDTSDASSHLPVYHYADVASLDLPQGCALVGVELLDESIDLPSFRHPLRAAYVLGPERGSLSKELLERCDAVVRIPTRFCINIAVAGAIVMYDRTKNLAPFSERPVVAGGAQTPREPHVYG